MCAYTRGSLAELDQFILKDCSTIISHDVRSVSTFVTLTKERQYWMRSPVREVSKSESLKIFHGLKENHYHVPSLNFFLEIYFQRSLYWNGYILAR